MKRNVVAFLLTLLVFLVAIQAVEPPDARKQAVIADEASRDGKLASARIKLPKGLLADLFAGEPFLANPVSFCFDLKGNIYVAETYRMHSGVTDNRGHMDWLDDDLACLTVADREAKYRKYLKEKFLHL